MSLSQIADYSTSYAVGGMPSGVTLWSYGKTRFLTIQAYKQSSSVTSGSALGFTIPQGHRPAAYVFANLFGREHSQDRLSIGTDGIVTYRGYASLAANETIYCSCMWVV